MSVSKVGLLMKSCFPKLEHKDVVTKMNPHLKGLIFSMYGGRCFETAGSSTEEPTDKEIMRTAMCMLSVSSLSPVVFSDEVRLDLAEGCNAPNGNLDLLIGNLNKKDDNSCVVLRCPTEEIELAAAGFSETKNSRQCLVKSNLEELLHKSGEDIEDNLVVAQPVVELACVSHIVHQNGTLVLW